MGRVNLNVDIESLSVTKELMDSKYYELLDMFNRYRELLEDTKNIYDTSSATLYREIGTKYLDIGIKYLKNDFKPYIDELNNIKKVYLDTYERLSNSTNGGKLND